jgi:MoaA/NifB/PqqE/SkfB family radical SAM enzyme
MKRKYFLHLKKRLIRGDVGWIIRNAWKYVGIPVSSVIGRPLTGPILGGIIVTYNCNYRCLFCDYWKRDRGDKEVIDTEQMLSVIDDFKTLGTSGVGFTGGEPLLCKNLFDLIRHAKQKQMTTSVASNGSLIDEKTAEDLLGTGVDMVSISIDAPVRELHDKMRGIAGSFSKAVSAFSNLTRARKKLGLSTTLVVNTVLNLQNIDYILRMPGFAASLGADSFNILGVETLAVQSDIDKRREDLEIKEGMIAKIDTIIDELIASKRKTPLVDNSNYHLRLLKRQFRGEKLPIRCFAGNTSLYVDCFGDVFACMANVELSRPLGNINQGGLVGLWKSAEYQKARRHLNKCRNCYFTCQNEFNVLFSIKAKLLR